MRLVAVIMITTVLVSVSMMARAAGETKTSHYILIENLEDPSVGLDVAKTKEIKNALAPYASPARPFEIQSYNGALFSHLDYVAVRPAQARAALGVLSKIQGIAAFSLDDVLQDKIASSKPMSVKDVKGDIVGFRFANDRAATIRFLTSDAFQAELPKLSVRERYLVSIHLFDAISSVLNAAGVFEHEALIEARREYFPRKDLDDNAKAAAINQKLADSFELRRVQEIKDRHIRKAIQLANQINGGPSEPGLLFAILGGIERVSSVQDVDAYFDVIERAFQNQIDLGKQLADLHHRGRAAELMRQGSFRDLMSTSSIRIQVNMFEDFTGLYFFDAANENSFTHHLFVIKNRWREVLKLTTSRDPAIAAHAADRVVQLVAKYEPAIDGMLQELIKNLPQKDVQVFAGTRIHLEPFAKLLAAIKDGALSQNARIGLKILPQAPAAKANSMGRCEALFKAN